MAADPNSELTAIDQQLLELLSRRIEATRRNAEAERDVEGGTSPAPTRALLPTENELAMRDFSASLGLAPDLAITWLRHAASVCESVSSSQVKIAYLGPIYSYSYLAAVKHFGLAASLVPVATISAAFEEVIRGQSQFAVVPIENSTDGRVVDTLGMFAKATVEISGEVLLPVHHCLLGKCERAEIMEVHSKPQALSQCREWLAEHLPEAILVEVASTALASANAADRPGVASIASREAGIHHGLRVIDENIEDNSQNLTRFVVIGQRAGEPTGRDKTSIMFQLDHRPGALAGAMVVFQQANVNLTWIESFPLPNRPNEYLFFIELEGHRDDPNVSGAINLLRKETPRLDVLGSYPRGKG